MTVAQADTVLEHYVSFWHEKEGEVPCYTTSLFPLFADLGLNDKTKVLDIGCGNGVVGDYLIRNYGSVVYGTEIAEEGLAQSLRKGYTKAITGELDSDKPPFPDVKFDLVVISAVVEHVFDPSKLIRQAYRSLKGGGKLIVLTPNVSWIVNRFLFAFDYWHELWLGGCLGHIRYMNKRQLRERILYEGFQNLDWSYSVSLIIPEEATHLYAGPVHIPVSRKMMNRRVLNNQELWAHNFIVVARKPLEHDEVASAELKQNQSPSLKVMHMVDTNRGTVWVEQQLKGLRALGHDVGAVIASPGSTADSLTKAGIPVHFHSVILPWKYHEVLDFFARVYSLALWIAKNKFDVVHYHLNSASLVGRLAAWIADVPVRISMIPGPFFREATIPCKMERETHLMDTRIVASCVYTSQLYDRMAISGDKVDLIYYGPDANDFDPDKFTGNNFRQELSDRYGISKDAFLIGMAAYFFPVLPVSPFHPPSVWGHPCKDHLTVIEAAKIVLETHPDVKFVFAGDGFNADGHENYLSLLKHVADCGLEKSILFVGHRNDIQEVLAAFDISIQSSHSENLGGTIESLLMKKPVIATKVGGMVDSIKHRETGLLVEPKSAKQMAEAIIELIENKSLAQTLGSNGRAFMLSRFTLTTTVDSLNQLYQRSFKPNYGHRPLVMLMRAFICLPIVAWISYLSAKGSVQINWRPQNGIIYCWLVMKGLALDLTNRLYWAAVGLKGLTNRLYWAFKNVSKQFQAIVKRSLDISLALLLGCLLAPLIFSKQQQRKKRGLAPFDEFDLLGQGGKSFKLRSFGLPYSEKYWWLPALSNILTGDLSFVGPSVKLNNTTVFYALKPGITGWAQLHAKTATAEQLIEMDELYVGTNNLWLDSKIVMKTLTHLLTK